MENNKLNNIDNFYNINPYDNFPYNYTKAGQEYMKSKLENKNYYENNTVQNQPQVNNVATTESTNNQFQNNQSNFNISQMLPYLLAIGNKNGGNNELLNSILPLFNNKNNTTDINNLTKLMQTIMNNSSQQNNKTEIINTENSVIDKLEKI